MVDGFVALGRGLHALWIKCVAALLILFATFGAKAGTDTDEFHRRDPSQPCFCCLILRRSLFSLN